MMSLMSGTFLGKISALFFHVAVAQAVALVRDVGCHGVEGVDVGNLVLRGQLAAEFADDEGVAVTGHLKHGLQFALRIHIRGLLKIQESPGTSDQQSLANKLNHVVMALAMHCSDLQRRGGQLLAFDADEVLEI